MNNKVSVDKSKKIRMCVICTKIICGGCGWEPNDSEVVLIQQKIIISCVKCGWKPGSDRSRLV